jgi:hypothetical protein
MFLFTFCIRVDGPLACNTPARLPARLEHNPMPRKSKRLLHKATTGPGRA